MDKGKSLLILEAFILDTYIESPESCLIVLKDTYMLFSEVLNQTPGLMKQLNEEREKVYRKLGWEVPR